MNLQTPGSLEFTIPTLKEAVEILLALEIDVDDLAIFEYSKNVGHPVAYHLFSVERRHIATFNPITTICDLIPGTDGAGATWPHEPSWRYMNASLTAYNQLPKTTTWRQTVGRARR